MKNRIVENFSNWNKLNEVKTSYFSKIEFPYWPDSSYSFSVVEPFKFLHKTETPTEDQMVYPFVNTEWIELNAEIGDIFIFNSFHDRKKVRYKPKIEKEYSLPDGTPTILDTTSNITCWFGSTSHPTTHNIGDMYIKAEFIPLDKVELVDKNERNKQEWMRRRIKNK
jgi:hypothetical protein